MSSRVAAFDPLGDLAHGSLRVLRGEDATHSNYRIGIDHEGQGRLLGLPLRALQTGNRMVDLAGQLVALLFAAHDVAQQGVYLVEELREASRRRRPGSGAVAVDRPPEFSAFALHEARRIPLTIVARGRTRAVSGLAALPGKSVGLGFHLLLQPLQIANHLPVASASGSLDRVSQPRP